MTDRNFEFTRFTYNGVDRLGGALEHIIDKAKDPAAQIELLARMVGIMADNADPQAKADLMFWFGITRAKETI